MKKRILLITPIPSHPQIAGNRARIFNLALSIKNLGHELFFLHVAKEAGDEGAMENCWGTDFFFTFPYQRSSRLISRIRRKLNTIIDPEARYISYIDDWYDPSLDIRLKELYQQFQFDIVLVEYAFFSKALKCFPQKVRKLLDTHDVLTNRHKLYLNKQKIYNWFSTTRAQERKGLRRADVVISIQDKERSFFSKLTGKPIVTVGHTVKIKNRGDQRPLNSRILYIGSANQSNVDALDLFCREMLPRIRQEVPSVTLMLAGPICRVDIEDMEIIEKKGEAIDLDAAYDGVDVVINPIRFGTGLKIKNIEALGYAKPLVTTSVGAEGIEDGVGKAFLAADDSESFSDAVIRILKDEGLYRSLSENGLDYAVRWNRKQLRALEGIIIN